MGARTIGRECALMVLFGVEADPSAHADGRRAAREFFLHLAPGSDIAADEEARAYTEEIAFGVVGELEKVDELIRKCSANWRLERMSRVDRNVLRIGAWELSHGVPRAVAIDEAVELGKKFGSETSGAFINGVLTPIADLLAR
ncbi:MAG: transcription antitermination factor NusB [Myxococcales bacterium]|nr:transcription antitermination factor NusB [Myxococcales bacterium]